MSRSDDTVYRLKRPNRARTGITPRRRLSLESLESRQLLAGEILTPLPADPAPVMQAEVGMVSPEHVSAAHGLEITDNYVVTHHDRVPRFANIPIAGSPIITNTQSGNWSDPAVWSSGAVPGNDARVQISPGITITYDVDSEIRLDAIEIQGELTFATNTDTRMFIDVLMVMPAGTLTIGTEANPVRPGVTAEIIFRGDTALKTGTIDDPGIDPSQFGKGLLAFGKVTMYGQQKDPTFVRLAADAQAGDMTLTLDQAPIGWRVGDRLVVPDTRQIALAESKPKFTSQAEEVVITAISGQQVTLSGALSFDHLGPRDAMGNVGAIEQQMLPHIGNLSRNLILRSENPEDVSRRGHTMFLHRADVDLRYAAFEALGRTSASIRPGLDNTTFDDTGNLTKIGTNQKGRYSIHFHHVAGPENADNTGYQGKVVGSVIEDFMKWGVTLHDTHYFLIQSNVAYAGRGDTVSPYTGAGGSAFATEAGNESFNVFDRNFVVHTDAGDSQRVRGTAGRGGIYRDDGISRDGFWFRGMHNYVRNNVVANAPDFAYNYNGDGVRAVMKVPRFRGADMMDPSHYDSWNPTGVRDQDGQIIGVREGLPALESSGNEAYGATGQGLWISRPQGGFTRIDFYSDQTNLFENFRIWHVSSAGVYDWGQDNRNNFVDFVLRNDSAISALSAVVANVGLSFGDTYYATGQLMVRDFDIQGFNIGIQLPHRPNDFDARTPDISFFENGVLHNHINIEDRYARWSKKQTVIQDVSFDLVSAPAADAIPANPLNIWMHPDNHDAHTLEMNLSRLLVFDFDKQAGINFEVYFEAQAPDAIVQPYHVSRGRVDETAPGVGLTVQEAWDQFGVAPAGAVAPSQEFDGDNGETALARAAELNIKGLLFAFEGDPPPVPDPPPLPNQPASPDGPGGQPTPGGPGVVLPSFVGWSLDEGTGTDVVDASDHGFDGTISGDVVWTAGQQGSALEFSGSDGLANAGNVGHSNQLTVSAWVKRGISGGSVVVTKTQANWEWELQYNSKGKAYFVINGVPARAYLGDLTGQWIHLAGTYDKSEIRLYLNGELVGSTPYTEDVRDLGNWVGIGQRVSGGDRTFGGVIDDVRIYNRALSATELASLSPTSHWPLDEGTGTNVSDLSGNGNEGAIQGDVTWTAGRDGSALKFNGTDGVVDAGNVGHSNQLTVSAWVKRGIGGGGVVVTKTQARWEWELQLNSRGHAYFMINGVNAGAYLGDAVGQWIQLTGTYDKSEIRLYRDGELIGSTPYTEDVSDIGNSVGIGRRVSGGGASFSGLIDDVRIYRRALAASEILALGSPIDPTPVADQVADPLDVNGDGDLTVSDALRVINELARSGQTLQSEPLSPLGSVQRLDVNGDGAITSLDALRVINEIARRSATRAAASDDELTSEDSWNVRVDDAFSSLDLLINPAK